jgi:hypothetical protein
MPLVTTWTLSLVQIVGLVMSVVSSYDTSAGVVVSDAVVVEVPPQPVTQTKPAKTIMLENNLMTCCFFIKSSCFWFGHFALIWTR